VTPFTKTAAFFPFFIAVMPETNGGKTELDSEEEDDEYVPIDDDEDAAEDDKYEALEGGEDPDDPGAVL
jgi:hypothetical protein